MAVSKETLEKHLIQVRRIAEHREAKAEQNIRYYFGKLKKDLNSFLGNEYAKLAEDDKLTYAILQQKGEYARFLEEVISKVDGISPKLRSEVQSLVEETYKTCYKGLVKGVEDIDDMAGLAKEFKAISAISPETVKRAVQNPIKKLTLNSTLERNRKQVISNIRREINIGLTQGDRMSTMANRISKHVEQDYRKAMLIARTEAHRVRESGFNDAAESVDTILSENDSEFRMVKTWRNMRDGAVRHTNLANHVEMEGVTVLQDEDFELSDGSTAACPGSSGVAAQDCNCRCFLARRIMNDEEYYRETGKHFPGYTEPRKQLKTLERKEADIQAEMDALNQTKYSNIWKDDVTASDYVYKQDKIQSKLDYFNKQYAIDGDSKWQNLIRLTNDFEYQGKQYIKLSDELHNTQQKLNDLRTKLGIVEDKWTAARKAAAKNFVDRVSADQYYRPLLDAKWNQLSNHEKYSVWEYTHNSHPINKVLSGYHDSWDRSSFLGLGNTDWDHENPWRSFGTANFRNNFGVNGHVAYANTIKDLTNAIEKSELANDVWLVRGSDTTGLAGLFEGAHISFAAAKSMLDRNDIAGLFNQLKDLDFENHAFMSTGIASNSGFGGSVKYKIYAPKGTKAIYAEPQSYFGSTISGEEIYTAGKPYSSVSSEAEVILQRGTKFRLKDMKINNGTIEVELDVISSPDYFKTGYEQTFNGGVTSHPATK